MHHPAPPPLPPLSIRPWFTVGEVAERLPAVVAAYSARIPPLDPSEDRGGGSADYLGVPPRHGVGAIGQPFEPQSSSAFEPYWEASAGALSEQTLIQAHRVCACCPEPERMPWEGWSPGQWEWYRRRQRVTAQRQAQREARRQKAGVA